MALHKTDLARDTLARTTGTTLALRERRVLILADGRRTRADLRALLVGEDVDPLVASLCARGFLRDDAPVVTAPAATAPAPRPPAAAATSPAPAPAAAPARTRRSLVAAKMYVADQLQLQRDPALAALREALHAAREEGDLVVAIAAGTRALAARTSPSVGARMRERVREALPEALLPQFDALEAPPAVDHAHEAVRVA